VTDDGLWTERLSWGARGAARLIGDERVRARVAERLGLEAVKRLDVEAETAPWLDGLEIRGRLMATVTRLCGLSLDAFDETVDEPFRVRVVPPGSVNAPEASSEVVIDLAADDPPEVAPSEGFDLAGYAVECLSLALDPFPRKPGAVFAPPAESVVLSPFAILKDVKARRDT
jgi:hypothetical protein